MVVWKVFGDLRGGEMVIYGVKGWIFVGFEGRGGWGFGAR